ncbi:hypothetical protein L1987_85123 [Smallanthus sonchifolius]|uniref:Uncharacterized protein n=1 Tax=Smallanthus sonchifolius TaxID=185202 RepID=A0ACB8XVN1_9ASTR|nr:hypothetical protein L1987_85123 [Smallanthus sonchifolius]
MVMKRRGFGACGGEDRCDGEEEEGAAAVVRRVGSRETEIQRPVNQCQRFVEQQIRSPRTIEMSTNRPGRQQQQGLQQCCDELQNVRRECQCEAIKEVARKMMRQQGGRSQYGGQQGQTEIVRRVVQNLPNQCYLEVQQCSIPYEMF